MSKKLSQFLSIITEGDTTDGREVTATMIEDCAKHYKQETYGARINIEHLRSLSPDSNFKMYGDVVAARVGTKDIFGVKKKTLEVQLSCDPDMVEIAQKNNQKIYFSAEITPNFAKNGFHYLTGLAMTDSPASLGSDILKFASEQKVNPLSNRKSNPDAMIVQANEVEALKFTDEPKPAEQPQDVVGLLKTVLLSLVTPAKKEEAPPVQTTTTTTPAPFDPAAFTKNFSEGLATTLGEQFNKQNEAITALKTGLESLTKNFTDMKTELDKTPASVQRSPAAGGNTNAAQTDC